MKMSDTQRYSPLAMYKDLPKPVYALFAATVVNGAGIFVFPFLTLFLTRSLGMDTRQAGNFMFFTSIAYLPGAILGGKLADRYGRKIVAVGAQILAASVYIPCGILVKLGSGPGGYNGVSSSLAMSAAVLIPALILVNVIFDGFADPARMAMHTDLTTPENRQAAFSLNYIGHNLGFAIGPLIAGFLFNHAPQWLFWGNAIAVAAATTLVWLFVPETKPSHEAIQKSLLTESDEKAHVGGLLSAAATRPMLLAFVFLNAWFGLVYAQHRFALPLQTGDLFGTSGATLYGGLMTMNALLVLVFTVPLIALLKKVRPVLNVALSGGLFALGFGMLAFTRHPAWFFVSVFIWTMGEIINATNADVYIANHTPMSHRGRFNSILPFLGGFGWALATPVGGNIIHDAGIGTLWLVMFGVAGIAAAGLLVLDRAESRSLRRRALPLQAEA
ncbi:MAG: MFS transporter, partial [Spirochaetota bacterium]